MTILNMTGGRTGSDTEPTGMLFTVPVDDENDRVVRMRIGATATGYASIASFSTLGAFVSPDEYISLNASNGTATITSYSRVDKQRVSNFSVSASYHFTASSISRHVYSDDTTIVATYWGNPSYSTTGPAALIRLDRDGTNVHAFDIPTLPLSDSTVYGVWAISSDTAVILFSSSGSLYYVTANIDDSGITLGSAVSMNVTLNTQFRITDAESIPGMLYISYFNGSRTPGAYQQTSLIYFRQSSTGNVSWGSVSGASYTYCQMYKIFNQIFLYLNDTQSNLPLRLFRIDDTTASQIYNSSASYITAFVLSPDEVVTVTSSYMNHRPCYYNGTTEYELENSYGQIDTSGLFAVMSDGVTNNGSNACVSVYSSSLSSREYFSGVILNKKAYVWN